MIKFLDLQKINAQYQNEFHQKLQLVLDNGWFILGNEVAQFEKNFATYTQSKYTIGVGNGLDALILIFKGYMQLGLLQKGDEVLVPANTYIASILAILHADLEPVLVEPKLDTYTINPDLIEEKISPKTKAILPVHLYGQLCEMDKIYEIALKNNLLLIEDAAQSHGAFLTFKRQSLDVKRASAYSFYPGKNLGALGDAGAITTNDYDLAKVVLSLRNYGSEKKYHNKFVGFNSRLDELQAAFLNIKLPFLDLDNHKRRVIAKRYLSEIKNDKIILPTVSKHSEDLDHHVFHLFVIRTANRLDLQHYLQYHHIETMIHYPVAPHQQKALEKWSHLSFPVTEKIHREVLSLPISPILTEGEVDFVIDVLNKY